VAVVLAVTATWTSFATPAPAAVTGAVEETGYLTARDGTHLRYDVLRPADGRRHPAVLNYEGYGAGTDAGDNAVSTYTQRLIDRGYAVVGVSVRGTGCSGGVFDPFEERMGLDGYDAVEWIARQRWSNGRVGMLGVSFGAITQLLTGRHRPPHLVALAASSSLSDLYRDVAYPGGILNDVFPFAWTGLQKDGVVGVVRKAAPAGDAECVANFAQHEVANLSVSIPQLVLEHPFTDDPISGQSWASRSPYSGLSRIAVPTLLFNSWQDEQLPGRLYEWLGAFGRGAKVWANFSNGNHGRDVTSARAQERTLAFLDRFVKGVANGFDTKVPHLTLWMESAVEKGGDENVPAWEVGLPLQPRLQARAFYLASGGRLQDRPARTPEAPDSYLYPLPASSMLEPGQAQISGTQVAQLSWKVPDAPGGYAAYTSAPLARDLVAAGPASLDLWLTSTRPDTDLQVTVTEVRPDGQETYVQRGWLRVSQRRLDPRLSTALRPYQTHRRLDVQSLVPGAPTLARVEVFPFAHAFRRGSRLRVWVDAPTGATGLWGFSFLPAPSVNAVLHDPAHPSRLVLGVLPGAAARAPLPACDTLRNQPCRPDPLGP
jgi:hypothetical protein